MVSSESSLDNEMKGWGGLETFSESTHAEQITKRLSEKDNDIMICGSAQLGGNERCPVRR